MNPKFERNFCIGSQNFEQGLTKLMVLTKLLVLRNLMGLKKLIDGSDEID